MKHKERLRNCSRFEESNEIQLLTKLWDSGPDHEPKKAICGAFEKIQIKFK